VSSEHARIDVEDKAKDQSKFLLFWCMPNLTSSDAIKMYTLSIVVTSILVASYTDITADTYT